MTYEEAQTLYARLKTLAIGALVKDRLIESLFIGPTDWNQMTDFMNLRIQKGDEAALIEFSSLGKSLSVYGSSVTKNGDGVPRWDVTVIDDFELMLSN